MIGDRPAIPYGTPGRRPGAALLLLASALAAHLPASAARAQLFDARSMGMGGVATAGNSNLITRVNPAYRAVPSEGRDWPRSFPVPLGLVQAAIEFPELDPDSDDFNLVGVVNYALNIPTAFELLGPDDPSGDIDISVGRDRLVIDLRDAKEALPDDDFHLGSVRRYTDLGVTLDLGRARGVVHLAAIQTLAHNELDLRMDDALRDILADAQPVAGGRVYRARVDGIVQGGFSSGVTYARELPLPSGRASTLADDAEWMDRWWEADWRRLRVWGGASYRRLFGLGLARLAGEVDFTAGSPIFADEQSFDVDYQSIYTTATPDGPFDLASGQAIDAGLVLRWRNLEIGAGVADLLADLTWDGARRDRFAFDEAIGEVTKELIDPDLRVVEDVPTSWLVNAECAVGAWLFAVDHGRSAHRASSHLGTEWWRSPRLALRAGLELDQRDLAQAGVGVGLRGLRGSRLGLDLGLRTHSRSLSGERGLSLGLAVVLE